MPTYDASNIFAKILRGELPCYKVYEDDKTLAFLDIMPRAQGHALVVTKEKARDFFDISPSGLAKLMTVVQKLAPKIKDAMGAEGVLIQQFNGAAAGQKSSASISSTVKGGSTGKRPSGRPVSAAASRRAPA